MQVDSVASGLGATAAFFKDFFPTAFAHLSTGWPALWSLVQPGWLAEQCPEQQLIGGAFAIRNPSLLPWQAAGVAVAAAGLRRLRGPAHAYLRASLLLFAGMNLCSVICHALAARGSPLWHASRLADIACTGGSSLCLLLHQVAPAPATAAAARAAARRCCALVRLLLSLCTADELWAQLPWAPEFVYLGMTAAAAAVTSLRLYRSWARLPRGSPAKRQRLPLLLTAAAAAGMMANCLALDPLLCAVAGPWMGTTSLLFAGSALGFAAIVALAAAEERAMASAAGKRQ